MSSAQQGKKKSCFHLRVQFYQTLPAYLNPWATYYVQTEEFRVIYSLLILHHCSLPVAVGVSEQHREPERINELRPELC